MTAHDQKSSSAGREARGGRGLGLETMSAPGDKLTVETFSNRQSVPTMAAAPPRSSRTRSASNPTRSPTTCFRRPGRMTACSTPASLASGCRPKHAFWPYDALHTILHVRVGIGRARRTRGLTRCPLVDRREVMPGSRRFPPPWTVEETAPCFIVRDHNAGARRDWEPCEPQRRSIKAADLGLPSSFAPWSVSPLCL